MTHEPNHSPSDDDALVARARTDREAFGELCSYEMAAKLAKDPKIGDSYTKFASKKFLNESATLVALLVVNDRTAEAEEVMHELKKVEGDGKLHAKLTAELEKAIQGVVPKPWP